ncbi:hypothetical protein BH11PSE9_BH11PSE9_34000 [soil metagenome]
MTEATTIDATLTSKSQLTLPKVVRESLGVGSGDSVRFVPSRDGYRIVAAEGDLQSLRGLFKGRRQKPLSIAAMNEAIARMGSEPEGGAPKATKRGGRRA